MQRIPFALTGEYVGTKAGGSFERDGRTIDYAPKVQFLVADAEDGASIMEVSGTVLDRVEPPLNYSDLGRGDTVELSGVCVIAERGSDRDSFVRVTRAVPATARNGKATATTPA